MSETKKLIVFQNAEGYIDYLAGCGSVTVAVNYVPPGKLMNVKVELQVTEATKCFIVCSPAEPHQYDAKVHGTTFDENGVERETVFLEARQLNDPELNKVYVGNTDRLPHIVTVEFCKTGFMDPGAYWLTFTLILTYTYEAPPTPTSLKINSKTLEEKTVAKIAYLTSPTGYRDTITLPFGPKGLTPDGTWLVEIVSPDFIKWENEDTNKQRSLELIGVPVTVTAYFASGEPPNGEPPSNIWIPIIVGGILIGGIAYYLMKG